LGANGNRLSLTEGTGRIVDYTYDDLYCLITETVTDPVNGNHQSEFSYDPVADDKGRVTCLAVAPKSQLAYPSKVQHK